MLALWPNRYLHISARFDYQARLWRAMVTLCQLNCHVCRLAAAQNLFLLTRVCSELCKPYMILDRHITESLSPGGTSAIPNPKRAVRLDVQPSPRRAPQTGNISKHRALRVWNRALIKLDLSSPYYDGQESYRVHIAQSKRAFEGKGYVQLPGVIRDS